MARITKDEYYLGIALAVSKKKYMLKTSLWLGVLCS